MLSLMTVFAMHVPPSNYLKCDDYEWLKQEVQDSNVFTPVEKFEIILNWMEHTDPHCFDNKDAHD